MEYGWRWVPRPLQMPCIQSKPLHNLLDSLGIFSTIIMIISSFSARCNPCSFWWPFVGSTSYFPTDWCCCLVAWPRFPSLCLLKSHLPRHASAPQNSPSNQPRIQIALKSGPPQIGVELRPNLVLKSGQRGQKRPFVVILNYPASMSGCMCFPPFSPQSGLWPPETEMGWRQRPSIDSTCSNDSNFLPSCSPTTKEENTFYQSQKAAA